MKYIKTRLLTLLALMLFGASEALAQSALTGTPDIELTPSDGNRTWTLASMPDYDLELSMEYYDSVCVGNHVAVSCHSAYQGNIAGGRRDASTGDTILFFEGSTPLTLTASGYDGYAFIRWSDGNSDNPRTVTVVGDTAFHPVYIPTHTLTLNAGEGGTLTLDGYVPAGANPEVLPAGVVAANGNSYTVMEGTSVSVTATPDSAHYLTALGGHTYSSHTAVTLDTAVHDVDVVLAATFTTKPLLTLATTTGGTLAVVMPAANVTPVAGTNTYYINYGTDVTLQAAPAMHYHLQGWSANVVAGADSTASLSGMTANQTVSATFAQNSPELAWTYHGSAIANGAVITAYHGFEADTIDLIDTLVGAEFTAARLNEGAHLRYGSTNSAVVSYDDHYNYSVNGPGTTVIYMVHDGSLMAYDSVWFTFTLLAPDTLTLAHNQGGAMTVETLTDSLRALVADSTYAAVPGAGVTVKATPDATHYFVNWDAEAALNSNAAVEKSYTLSGNLTSTATFAAKPILTLAQNEASRGTVALQPIAAGVASGATANTYIVDYGTTVTVVADASALYHVAGWKDQNDNAYTSGITYSHYAVTDPMNLYPDSSSLTLTLTADTTAKALFGINSYNVFASAQLDSRATIGTDSSMGYIAVSYTDIQDAAQSAGPADTVEVTSLGGAPTTLTALPHYGYLFNGWNVTLNGMTTQSTLNPLTVSEAAIVEARFVPDTFTVSTALNIATAGNVTGAGRYAYRTLATLEEAPATGYHFVNWTAGETVLGTAATLTVQTLGDTALTANYDTNTYNITYSVQNDSRATIGSGLPMGTVTLDGRHMHFLDDVLEATPAYGYLFEGWYSNNVLVSTDNPYTFSPVSDSAFEARFVPDTFTVSTALNIATAGNVTGAGRYAYRTLVTLEEVPATGYHFVNWTAGETVLGTAATLTVQTLGDTAITANYDTNVYNITYSVQNDSRATIGSGLPMGTVTLDGRHMHFLDDVLEATPAYGYLFSGWYSNNVLVSTDNPYTFSPVSDSAFEARFVPDTFTVSTALNIATAGNVTGAGRYAYRTLATLEEAPATGYHFVNWTAGEAVLGTAATLTVQTLGDTAITANYDTNVYNVVTNVNIEGLGTVTGAGQVKHFLSTTLVATANQKYHFVNWVDAQGGVVSTADTLEVFPTGDTVLTAVFDTNIYATVWSGATTTTYNSQPYTGLTATYSDFWGHEHTPVLTFVCGNDTVVTPNYPVTAGTWTVTATPEVGDSLTSPVTTLTIDRATVYVSGAAVETAKFADGTTTAVVTNAGTLNNVQGSDALTHTTLAAFNDATVGDNKTIIVDYTLVGTSALLANYTLMPISEIYTTSGYIIEPIVPDTNRPENDTTVVEDAFDIYAYGYCSGESYLIRYHLNSGVPDQYKLDFADSRFTDVDWTNLSTPGAEGSFPIVVPVDLPMGDYSVTVTFRDSRFSWLESAPMPMTFHVNLPETFTMPLFDNVIALVDTCHCFTDIQWYHRANAAAEWYAIPGATGYYYHATDSELQGQFFVKAKYNGVETFTCPQTDMETLYTDDEQTVSVTAYPNPTTDDVTITVDGTTERSHTLRVMSTVGVEMVSRTFEGSTTSVDMRSYATGTYMVIVDGVAVRVVKR